VTIPEIPRIVLQNFRPIGYEMAEKIRQKNKKKSRQVNHNRSAAAGFARPQATSTRSCIAPVAYRM